MEMKSLPKETLADLLLFLAEYEEFHSVSKLIKEGITVEEVRENLRTLAATLKQEAGAEPYQAQKDNKLSDEAKSLISCLSPGEEKTLLKAFGLIDNKSLL